MKTIWKYHLNTTDKQDIRTSPKALLRHVGIDAGNKLSAWYEIDTDAKGVWIHTIYLTGTGHPIPECSCRFITSVVDGPFVWHVWESDTMVKED